MPAKKPPAPPVRIVVDHRERASGVIEALQAIPNTEVVVAQLVHGDFEIAQNYVVERKESNDFVQSIFDRRLFQQVETREAAGVRSLIILDGSPFATRRASDQAVIGALSWITLIKGIPTIEIPPRNPQRLAMTLHTLARHSSTGLGYEISLEPPKPKSIRDQQISLVHTLPGVGHAKALTLLRRFGNVAGVVGATEQEIANLDGFGRAGASKIRQLIDTPFIDGT